MGTGKAELIGVQTPYSSNIYKPGKSVPTANPFRLPENTFGAAVQPQASGGGGVFNQLNQGIQSGVNPGKIDLGTGAAAKAHSVGSMGGNQASSSVMGALGGSSDDMPGKAMMEDVKGTQREIRELGREAAGTAEGAKLGALNNSLNETSQTARRMDMDHKQSKKLGILSKMQEMLSDKLKMAGEAMEKAGTAMTAAGTAMIESGKAMLSNPFTAAAGAALIAAGTALKLAGKALQLAGKALKKAADALKKICMALNKLIKKLMDMVKKLMGMGRKKIQQTRTQLQKIREALRKKRSMNKGAMGGPGGLNKLRSHIPSATGASKKFRAGARSAAQRAKRINPFRKTAAAKPGASAAQAAQSGTKLAGNANWKKVAAVGGGVAVAGFGAKSLFGGGTEDANSPSAISNLGSTDDWEKDQEEGLGLSMLGGASQPGFGGFSREQQNNRDNPNSMLSSRSLFSNNLGFA